MQVEFGYYDAQRNYHTVSLDLLRGKRYKHRGGLPGFHGKIVQLLYFTRENPDPWVAVIPILSIGGEERFGDQFECSVRDLVNVSDQI